MDHDSSALLEKVRLNVAFSREHGELPIALQ
jgi:hypothetical protein